jgi:hypothetical protein
MRHNDRYEPLWALSVYARKFLAFHCSLDDILASYRRRRNMRIIAHVDEDLSPLNVKFKMRRPLARDQYGTVYRLARR